MDDALRERVESLIATDLLSDSEIARRLGIHQTTVSRIHRALALVARDASLDDLRPGERRLPRPMRCPDCGGLITVVPCRLDRIRRQMESARAAREAGLVLSGPPAKRAAVKRRQLDLFGEAGPQLAAPRSKHAGPKPARKYAPLLNRFKRRP